MTLKRASLLLHGPDSRPPLPLLAPHDRLQHLPQVSFRDRCPLLGHGGQEEELLWMSGAKHSRFMIWVTRAGVSFASCPSSAWVSTAPASSSSWK